MKPKKAFTSAAPNDAPKVRRYEAIATGIVTVCQNCGHVRVWAFQNTAASGINTIRLR